MDKDKFKNLMAMAKAHPNLADMDIEDIHGPWPLPLKNAQAKSNYLGIGFNVRIHDRVRDEHFTALIAMSKTNGVSDFKLSCPSTLLVTGGASRTEFDAVVEVLGQEMAQPDSLVQSVSELYGRYPKNSGCSYTALARQDKLCGHLAAALSAIQDTSPDLVSLLEQKYAELITGSGSQATASSDDNSLAEFERYMHYVPILVEGERGGGKTYDAWALARKHGFPVCLLPGHEGVEPADMLGYMVKTSAHGYVWMDMPLAAAFRSAQTRPTVLLADELLRIPQRQLSVFLTALTPDEVEGVYRLPTGRVLEVVDGVAIAEVLSCPIENLIVIATTNVGGEYAVDQIDPALRERFHVIRRDTESDKLRAILTERVKAKSWSEAIVAQMMKLFEALNTLRTQGNLKAAPTTRTMCRALTVSRRAIEVGPELYAMNLQWVARAPDGRAVVQQQELVRKAVNAAFDIKIPEPNKK